MNQLLEKNEVQAQLEGKIREIKGHIDGLKQEVLTTGDDVKKAIFDNPLVGVGGALVGGVLVGLLLGGRRSRATPAADANAALLERYVEALAAQAQAAAERGADTGEAVRDALHGHAPLVVQEASTTSAGWFSRITDLLIKTALGFAVKAAADYATARFVVADGDGLAPGSGPDTVVEA